MINRWDDKEAAALNGDPVKLRVYTSRLLGRETDLVLHGGGNTSVKVRERNLFGEEEDLLYVKGSGWDLATIETPGFAPVRLDVLRKMAELEHLSDPDMVKFQRAAMTDPSAPNPSVEAILHAIIPFTFVDHSHADAIVTLTNTPSGADRIREVYGDRILVIPYVMPGFILAREIYLRTRDFDWHSVEGMILMNHGVFTFADDAKTSYDNMIRLVTEAENYIERHGAGIVPAADADGDMDALQVATVRQAVSRAWGRPVLARPDTDPETIAFSRRGDLSVVSQRGPVTPDHIIRTKQVPVLIEEDKNRCIREFSRNYRDYFDRNNTGDLTCLDPAPRWAVWPGLGALAFGRSIKDCRIIRDITRHTMKVIQQAEMLESWEALPEKDLFEMEYWVLEQAKLAKGGNDKIFQGKVALVTGSASGIGRACVLELVRNGAAVAALDIQPQEFGDAAVLPIACDLTNKSAVQQAVQDAVRAFGGLDILVSNAGVFPKSYSIAGMDDATWDKSLAVNLTAHRVLMTAAIPFLELGESPGIVLIGSKNVKAPGPGAGAYSVAKAGLTQLGRVASLELGSKGIRVNVIHPNAVYDTAIWTDQVLAARAAHYGLTVDEYKSNNVLGKEVTSADVAELAVVLASDVFSKITGAQVPIDGGNDRVI